MPEAGRKRAETLRLRDEGAPPTFAGGPEGVFANATQVEEECQAGMVYKGDDALPGKSSSVRRLVCLLVKLENQRSASKNENSRHFFFNGVQWVSNSVYIFPRYYQKGENVVTAK